MPARPPRLEGLRGLQLQRRLLDGRRVLPLCDQGPALGLIEEGEQGSSQENSSEMLADLSGAGGGPVRGRGSAAATGATHSVISVGLAARMLAN